MGIMDKLNEKFPDGVFNKEVRKDMKSMVKNIRTGGRTPLDENGNPIFKTDGNHKLQLKSIETERDLQRMANLKFVIDKNSVMLQKKRLVSRYLTKTEFGIDTVALYDVDSLKQVDNDFSKVEAVYVISPLIIFSPMYSGKTLYLRQGSDEIDDLMSYEPDLKQIAKTISNNENEIKKNEAMIGLYAEYNEFIYPMIKEAFDIENKYVESKRVDKIEQEYVADVQDYNHKFKELEDKKESLDLLEKELELKEKELLAKSTELEKGKQLYEKEVNAYNANLDSFNQLEVEFKKKQAHLELEIVRYKTGAIPYLENGLNEARQEILTQQSILYTQYHEYLLSRIQNLVASIKANKLNYTKGTITEIHFEALQKLEQAYPDVYLDDGQIVEELLGTTIEYIEAQINDTDVITDDEGNVVKYANSVTKETASQLNDEDTIQAIEDSLEEALGENDNLELTEEFSKYILAYKEWTKAINHQIGIDSNTKKVYGELTKELGTLDSIAIIEQNAEDLSYILAVDYYLEATKSMVTAVIGVTPYNFTILNDKTSVKGFKANYNGVHENSLSKKAQNELKENIKHNFEPILGIIDRTALVIHTTLQDKSKAEQRRKEEPVYKQLRSTEADRWLERLDNLSNLYKNPQLQQLLKEFKVRIGFSSSPIKLSPTEVYTDKVFILMTNKLRVFVLHNSLVFAIEGVEKPVIFKYETLQDLDVIIKSQQMKVMLDKYIEHKNTNIPKYAFLEPIVVGLNLKQSFVEK